jgi:hypothetical protein
MKISTACMLAAIVAATMGITSCASGGATTTTTAATSTAATVPRSYMDPNGFPCAPAEANGGYCPEDPNSRSTSQPSNSQSSSKAAAAARKAAAAKAAAKAAKIAAENTPISATKWGKVIRNPDAYIGDVFTILGTVTEYNINSNTFATAENAALVARDFNGNDFVVECDASKLGNVQPGQTFRAKVTVVGAAQTENTVSGGTGEIPDFDASKFRITG